MKDVLRILAINPGSTSTKVAVYDDEKEVFEQTLRHSNEELAPYKTIIEQYEFRKTVILNLLSENNINITKLHAVVGRGGLVKPIKSGTYVVNDRLIEDLKIGLGGQHASNLGGIIAREIASQLNIQAYIVDPVVVDELDAIARISGHPLIERKSIIHALNQKAVARRVAEQCGMPYEKMNMIIAHMGGGVSVGAHKLGRIVEVNNALDGDGPFSPERSGALPVGQVMEMCFSGKYTYEELKKMFVGKGGLTAYLGTNDGREVVNRIKNGDEEAKLIYEAMAYQVAKDIGACATVLNGKVDAIVLTGGLAYDNMLVNWIKERVEFIKEVTVVPGEDEMIALVEGGLRVLRGEEQAKIYE